MIFKRSFCILILVFLMVFAINTSAKKWTFMVYLDADNNLEPAGLDDFIEMAKVGSTVDFDVVVQLDLYSTSNSYGWATCKRFHVTQGMTPTVANAVSDIGEVNMGDPDTLVDFCKWTHDNYPSDNYFLVLWDHGDGWRTGRTKSRGACTDDHGPADPDDPSDPYYLNFANGELQAAFNEITTYTGGKWAGVGFDVCLDGMWENMVACEPYFDYFVASEMSEWNDGWSYWPFLEDLDAATGDLTGQQFADAMVDAYADGDDGNNNPNPSNTGDTLSSIDLSQISALNTAIDALAQELMCARDSGHGAEIDSVRNATFEVDGGSPYYNQIDLYDLTLNIASSSLPTSVKTAAANVQTANGNAVSNNFVGNGYTKNHGIAIYYQRPSSSYDTDYDGTDVVALTFWDNFLKGEGCPVPLLISYSSKIIDDSVGGDNNGSVDPGETIDLAVTLSNGGTDGATNVSATLSTTDTYVTITQNSSTYPNIASGGSETSNTDYTFEVDGSCPSGHEITFDLDISADTGYTNASSFTIKVGEKTFDSTDTPIAIPDNDTIVSTISIPNNCIITDIFVDVDITHPYKGDLIVILESPTGKRVMLHARTGSDGDNIQTSYDDVTTPDGPGAMSDFDGDGSFGDWKLIVSDNAEWDNGTLNSWSLVMFLTGCTGPFPILSYDSNVIDDSAGNSDGIADPGETISMPVTLKNTGNTEATSITAVLSTTDIYITINDDTASFPTITQTGGTGQSNSPHFAFDVSGTCPLGHLVSFHLAITSSEGSWSNDFIVKVGQASILLVDDDEANSYETAYTNALDTYGATYDIWDVNISGSPGLTDLQKYNIVIWFTAGAINTTLSTTEENNLASFLDGGGNLFLSSQDYLYDQGSSSTFDTDYLHVSSYTSDVKSTTFTGINGDVISDNMDFGTSYPFNDWSDDIVPDANATSIFTNAGGNPSGIRYPASGASTYKVVFFAFPFEALSDGAEPSTQNTLMANILDWFLDDSIPPADIIDLQSIGCSYNYITLEWTVPGDDDWTGTATLYDIRYAEIPINNDIDFDAATQCSDEPVPIESDGVEKQSFTVTGLNSNTTYYFAMKTKDEGNWSGLSNCAVDITGVIYAFGSETVSWTPGDGYHITNWLVRINAFNSSLDNLTNVTATVVNCDTWVNVVDDAINFPDLNSSSPGESIDTLEFDLTDRPGDAGDPTNYIMVWFNFSYSKLNLDVLVPYKIEIPKISGVLPPTDVTAEQILEHVRLTWSYKGSSEPDGFNIYKKISDSEWVKINDELITKYLFKDKDVTDRVRYSYKVTAVQFDIESGFSEVAKIKLNVDYEDVEHIQTYPNPARDKIVFNRLPKDAKITLYTLAGQEVITLYANGKNNIEWRLLNKAGKKVSAGIYFFVIESSKGSKKGKIAIIK